MSTCPCHDELDFTIHVEPARVAFPMRRTQDVDRRNSDPDAQTRQALRHAHLKYADPDAPGIQRRRRGKTFTFLKSKGAAIHDDSTLARIRSLAIPPAWENVWISPDPRSHIQAVGRDARGRKQYKYHADWRRVRDEHKYDHVIEFAKALPQIRRTAKRHLKL